ncbi:MAG: rhomboid family intramembrane serine protease [Clostridium sp.]|nr:rhomboid family intramembrane serine protease [Clostridium sp.]
MKELINKMRHSGYAEMRETAIGVHAMYYVQNGLPCVYCFIDLDDLQFSPPAKNKKNTVHQEVTDTDDVNSSAYKRAVFDYVDKKIREPFLSMSYESVAAINIVSTSDMELVKEVFCECKNYWVYDKKENRLVIFEEQPVDFFGFKRIVENHINKLDEGVVQFKEAAKKRKTKSAKAVWRKKRWTKSTIMQHITITGIIIIINALVYIITAVRGNVYSAAYMLGCGGSCAENVILDREYYRLFTSMFLHFGFAHIFSNMFSLFVIGYVLEPRMGKVRFAVVYILGGLAASVTSLIYHWSTEAYAVSAGASGAVYAMLGAYIVIMYLHDRAHFDPLRILLVLLMPLLSAFRDVEIDNAAHIGGLVAGIVLTLLIEKLWKRKSKWQKKYKL